MIRPAGDKPLKGGLGGSTGPLIPAAQIDERTPGKDLRLIKAAVRKGWVIREEVMSALPDAMTRLALDSQRDDRTRINAARVLVQMHGQNEPAPAAEVSVSVSVGDQVQGLLQEPSYLEYLRTEAVRDASTICESGEPGEIPRPPTRGSN